MVCVRFVDTVLYKAYHYIAIALAFYMFSLRILNFKYEVKHD